MQKLTHIFFADNCLGLFIRIASEPNLQRIKKLCSIIFFKIMGYRAQDAHKSPDMIKSIMGKSLIDILLTHRKSEEEGRKEKEEEVIEEIKLSISAQLFLVSILDVIITSILTIVYRKLFNQDYNRYPNHTEQYVFILGVSLTLFLSMMSLDRLCGWIGKSIRYFVILYKWRLTWKYFEYLSKIKYYFEDKRIFIILFIGIWYLILTGIMFYGN